MSSCQNNATCVDDVIGYTCECADGFSGVFCDVNVDDCVGDPCVNGTCVDDVSTFHCVCDAGFYGDLCELEVDECLSSPCGAHGSCVDLLDGFL